MKNNIDSSNKLEVIIKNNKYFTPIKIFILIISLAIIISSYIFFKNYSLVSSYNEKVYPGVYVLNKDLSGLNKEDLLNELTLLAKDLTNKTIKATSSSNDYLITYNELEYKLNVEELTNEILSYGKDKNFISKLNLIKKPQKTEFKFDYTYNEEALITFVENVYEDLYTSPIDATINISYNATSINNEVLGSELNSDKLKTDIINILSDLNVNPEITIQTEISSITPSITYEALSTVNKRIATFSTKFIYGPSGTNLQVATQNIDNTVIMPGETFSTDKAIGPTTLENGFVYSKTYVGGEVVEGLGGGVCQVSSTLYNTMLNAGIIPIERANHMMPVSYLPTGLDATLADDLIDLRFINEYDYPIVINASAVDGILTIEFWSNESTDDGINYQTYREVHSELDVDTYLYGYDANGTLVYNEYLGRSVYDPLP